ncbi:hypothetical protein [Streptomyces sp. NPDC055733]
MLPATTNHDTDTSSDRLQRVREWVTSDVVTARSEFGNGYREAQRDIRDLLHGRRVADETTATETQAAEDPARVDRLRPEFAEHASVESIDAQIQRAQRQERRWHLRAEWLISLRATRIRQKEHGEWPAAGARQDEAQP